MKRITLAVVTVVALILLILASGNPGVNRTAVVHPTPVTVHIGSMDKIVKVNQDIILTMEIGAISREQAFNFISQKTYVWIDNDDTAIELIENSWTSPVLKDDWSFPGQHYWTTWTAKVPVKLTIGIHELRISVAGLDNFLATVTVTQ